MIARILLLQLDGTLETESGVIGGTRCAVSIPRPRSRGMTMPACAAGPIAASPTALSSPAAEGGAEKRRAIVARLGGGAQYVRHAGRPQHRDHGGLRPRIRPADGDVLGRRAPGALFYLLRHKLFDDALLEKMPSEGEATSSSPSISGDMRVLQESGPRRPTCLRSGQPRVGFSHSHQRGMMIA